MKFIKRYYPIVIFIVIIIIGIIRVSEIHLYESKIGKSTMTGFFTFYSYFFIDILTMICCLLIKFINSIKIKSFNKYVKFVFVFTLLFLIMPIIAILLFVFH